MLAYLRGERDDGNKVYAVSSVHEQDPSLPAADWSQVLETLGDIFVVVDLQLDLSKHVKPVQSGEAKEKKLLFKTLGKYSWAESGTKYIKVQLTELEGLKDERLEVEFGERSCSVRVFDYKGGNWSFAVPKL